MKAAQFVALERIGWHTLPDAEIELGESKILARVIVQHRNSYELHDGENIFTAAAEAHLLRLPTEDRPAVGDWVAVQMGATPAVQAVHARHSMLKRAAAGEKLLTQNIAANIDAVFIVCGLDGDYNPRRIERYLMLVHGSGAQAVIVLTKYDLHADADQRIIEIKALAGDQVPLLVVNAKAAETADLLLHYLPTQHTGVLVGSSGAGKSTLINTLLGIEKQRTAGVRKNDSRGRHTTTARSLIMLPNGACLIDTPGMREIKLLGDEPLDTVLIEQIQALASECRFRDCQHRSEPGCHVQQALQNGDIEESRYQHLLKLQGERDHARSASAAQKTSSKKFNPK